VMDSICIQFVFAFQWSPSGMCGVPRGQVDFPKQFLAWQGGDSAAGNAVCSALDAELKVIAAAKLRRERHSSLSSGDLVNEALMKLYRLNLIEIQDREHLLALASKLMRQILIDQARKRNSVKRDHQAVTLSTNVAGWQMPMDVIDIHLALEELATIDPQRAEIVEMRFYGGMTNAEVAVVLGLSEATIKLRWAASRAWLHDRLKHGYARL
jgi:RNA polymerase sigma factor (TIGR02999 family)